MQAVNTTHELKWVNEIAVLRPTPSVQFVSVGDDGFDWANWARNTLIGVSITMITAASSLGLSMLVPSLAFPLGMACGVVGMLAFLELKV